MHFEMLLLVTNYVGACNIGSSSLLVAEVHALFKDLQYLISEGFKFARVERDCQNVSFVQDQFERLSFDHVLR